MSGFSTSVRGGVNAETNVRGLQTLQQSNAKTSLQLLDDFRAHFGDRDGTLRILHTTKNKNIKFKSVGGFKQKFVNGDRLSEAGKTIADLMKNAGYPQSVIDKFNEYRVPRGDRGVEMREVAKYIDMGRASQGDDREEALKSHGYSGISSTRLGGGGYGTVWAMRYLGQDVAYKQLNEFDEKGRSLLPKLSLAGGAGRPEPQRHEQRQSFSVGMPSDSQDLQSPVNGQMPYFDDSDTGSDADPKSQDNFNLFNQMMWGRITEKKELYEDSDQSLSDSYSGQYLNGNVLGLTDFTSHEIELRNSIHVESPAPVIQEEPIAQLAQERPPSSLIQEAPKEPLVQKQEDLQEPLIQQSGLPAQPDLLAESPISETPPAIPRPKLARTQDVVSNWMKQDIPNVIKPTAFVVRENTPNGRVYHTVPAGKFFKNWAIDKLTKTSHTFEIEGMVMPLAPGKQLMSDQQLSASKDSDRPAGERRFNEQQLGRLASSGFNSIYAAAQHGFVFGDIKPENIMTDGREFNFIDLGGLQKISRNGGKPEYGVGTKIYLLPTLAIQIPKGSKEVEYPASFDRDLYAFGLTLVETALRSEGKQALAADVASVGIGSMNASPQQIVYTMHLAGKDELKRLSALAKPPDQRSDNEKELCKQGSPLMAKLKQRLGDHPVTPDSALDFGLKCIEAALNHDARKTSRFDPKTAGADHPLTRLANHPIIQNQRAN